MALHNFRCVESPTCNNAYSASAALAACRSRVDTWPALTGTRILPTMASSRKKAIVRKLSRDWVAGYLPSEGFLRGGTGRDSILELLGLDGKVTALEGEQIKWVCFVRDFNSGEANNPERLLRKTFGGRPRTAGLFLRAKLTDGDLIEGIAANDLSLVSSGGLFLTPPDTRSNTQRIWIPASSVAELEVVAVIGGGPKAKPEAPVAEEIQERLF